MVKFLKAFKLGGVYSSSLPAAKRRTVIKASTPSQNLYVGIKTNFLPLSISSKYKTLFFIHK